MPLPSDLLRRIVAQADQATRVACCLASRTAYAALVHPDVWQHTTVHAPDDCALDFLRRAKPGHVKVCSSNVRLVQQFLLGLVAGGTHAAIRRLHLDLGDVRFPPRHTVLSCLAEYGALEDLDIECQAVKGPVCLAFSDAGAGLRSLRAVLVTERPHARSRARKVEVYFGDAHLPKLQDVRLEVATSDVLAHARRLPALDVVLYSGEHDTYEDAALDGVRLARLAVDVHCPAALQFLLSELPRARFIDRLSLTCSVNVCLETYVNMRHLCVCLQAPARRLDVVHAVVRGMASVSASHASHGDFQVCFRGAGSWSAFWLWLMRTELHVGLGGSVSMQA